VKLAAGDTKVVERGAADGLYITTAGLGHLLTSHPLSPKAIQPGDQVLVSGLLGEHGIAVISRRAGIEFDTPVKSDVAPLNGLVGAACAAAGEDLRCMRDPTRGGLAAVLNEFAQEAGLALMLDEAAIPVGDSVRGACELLGFDPLYVANEGKMVFVCAGRCAGRLLDALRGHPLGKDAAIIGKVREEPAGRVLLRTNVGGTRIVDMPYGEQLPRIC
jgi:hydrogenase expression/formation protein HypE